MFFLVFKNNTCKYLCWGNLCCNGKIIACVWNLYTCVGVKEILLSHYFSRICFLIAVVIAHYLYLFWFDLCAFYFFLNNIFCFLCLSILVSIILVFHFKKNYHVKKIWLCWFPCQSFCCTKSSISVWQFLNEYLELLTIIVLVLFCKLIWNSGLLFFVHCDWYIVDFMLSFNCNMLSHYWQA